MRQNIYTTVFIQHHIATFGFTVWLTSKI